MREKFLQLMMSPIILTTNSFSFMSPVVTRRSSVVVMRAASSSSAQRNTAMLLLSPSRLRLRDNAALTRAVELGSDGLSISLVWPYSTTHQLTPAEAFGFAATRALNDELESLGQTLHLFPSQDDLVQVVQSLSPSHLVVDTCLLDMHHNNAQTLSEKLHAVTNATNVLEVMDDGTLVSFNDVAKVLGRSRQGGRILRWSTFLNSTMKQQLEFEQHFRPIPSLPPPLHNDLSELATATLPIPSVDTFPLWAKQLLEDWGDISEAEAMRRAINSGNLTKEQDSSFSSSLTEKGSRNTKLSPYLRWGIISPQQCAHNGVRLRDLLWRDWSHVSYALLAPLRRGEAVMEFMNNSCGCSKQHDMQDVSETDLFHLWCVGNSGSALVDAGMRQLWKQGWMPRRIRLLAAACLVEGLGLDWRLGRDWFKNTLIDHDPAINEAMWQNAGLVGVDPFYAGITFEQPPTTEQEQAYVDEWSNESLIWPSFLKTYAAMKPPSQLVELAGSRRKELRDKGIYKAARRVSNAGVRVAWKGLSSTTSSIEAGEVIGIGLVPVHELEI